MRLAHLCCSDMGGVDEAPKYVERADRCQLRWRRRVDSVLDVLLPPHCVACGLATGAGGICTACFNALPWCSEACRGCGLPLPGAGEGICGRCLARPPNHDRVIAAVWYRFPARELIAQFKFQRHTAAGAVLADLLVARLLAVPAPRPDRIVPVPLHRWRLARRGFNQAYELARMAGRQLNLPVSTHGLRRTRPTRSQTGLGARERRNNLSRAFAWRGRPLAGKRVALVDDVMTTGATLRECATCLRLAGAACVDAWVVARADGP